MFRNLSILMVILLTLSLTACSRNRDAAIKQANTEEKPGSTPDVPVVEIERNQFDFPYSLWEQVNRKGENLFLSPFSIDAAMAMAYTGAAGRTAEEMGKVMGYEAKPDQEHFAFRKRISMLNDIPKRGRAQLNIANALFNAEANKDILIPEYTKTLQESFDSDLYSLDFNQAKETADFINQWVEKKTHERIKNIISERQIEDSSDGMVLVNSIYFKSDWMSRFEEFNTRKDTFYTSSERNEKQSKPMPMMKQTGTFGYGETGDCKVLEMPFAESELAMIFVLPQDIEATCAALDHDMWQGWLKSLSRPREVEVIIPRFRLEHTLDKLVDTFRVLGIRDAFDGGSANFSGIMKTGITQNLYISDIVHKAFLEVIEQGTEAAAATQVGFAKTSFNPPNPDIPVFRADQPFLCMIVHKVSNEILFMAKVVDPADAD